VRRTIEAVAICAGVFASLALQAQAADAPGWMHDAARDPAANAPADASAVILLDEQQILVKDNGEVETLHRRAYRILRPNGREFGHVAVSFDGQSKLTYLKAWCIPKDGKDYEVKEKDAVEINFHDEFYSDLRTKVLDIPAAAPGNVVGYEYVQKGRPFILQDEWWFQAPVFVRKSRFTLSIPGGWEFSNYWIHHAEVKPVSAAGTQTVWEVENIAPIKEEREMPPIRAVVERMAVTYHPPKGTTAAVGPGSWQQIGTWYSQLASVSAQPTPEIQQKVKELTANAKTWREKATALAGYVQGGIRYVAIEIGIGGFQPHTAADIFRHQYGDCKDKATLLRVMLREAGIDSYYALAQTERGIVTPEFASAISFNHAIVAIRVPDGEPAAGLFATVDNPKLGKLLLFDPTATYVPFGYLPAPLQENYVLVAATDGGELVKLPLLPPDSNKLARTAKFQLNADGSLTGSVEETRFGSQASVEREQLMGATGIERAKILENFLAGFLSGFHLTQASTYNLEKTNDSLGLHYQFTADHFAKTAGNLLLVHPRVLGEKVSGLADGEARSFPVEFEDASMQTDDFEISLPPGYVVDDAPPPMNAESAFATYTSQVQVNGGKIHYTRTYQVKQVIVPVEQLGELRRFDQRVLADERSNVVLRRDQ
jgi:transglutaminase-like putative cysteine protease